MEELFLTDVELKKGLPDDHYLSKLPMLQALIQRKRLSFRQPVTFFVGENGSGKSTLLEAIAVAYGFNAEGGSKNFQFSTKETHSELNQHLLLIKSWRQAKDGFFLRAESLYNLASAIEQANDDGNLLKSYGGRSLHDQSHGESFINLINSRFRGEGFYVLDEPEAALSPARQLALLQLLHQLVQQQSQLLIATHSPILLAYPQADIYLLDEQGIHLTSYEETEHYQLTKQFLNHPQQMLHYLLEE